MKHTPGPWIAVDDRVVGPSADDPVLICDCNTEQWQPHDAEGFENAKLIAAAPDLLEACEKALAYCWKSTNDNPEKLLEQAIAKAEGR